MKKILFAILLTTYFGGINSTNAQCVQQGTIIFNASYGFPNLYTKVLKMQVENDLLDQMDLKVGTLGPIGFSGEYLLADKIGFGINFTYANSSISWAEKNIDNNNNEIIYKYQVSVPRLRVLPTLNYHFGTSDYIDPYLVFGAGLNKTQLIIVTKDPDFSLDESLEFGLGVAVRAGIGARFFITPNIGAHLEIGVGGPLVLTGLSFKI